MFINFHYFILFVTHYQSNRICNKIKELNLIKERMAPVGERLKATCIIPDRKRKLKVKKT